MLPPEAPGSPGPAPFSRASTWLWRAARAGVIAASVPAFAPAVPAAWTLALGLPPPAAWGLAAALAVVPGLALAAALRLAGVARAPSPLSACAALGVALIAYAAGRAEGVGGGPDTPVPRAFALPASDPAAREELPASPGVHVVPYEDQGGSMFVEARVDGRGPFRFLFDTGSTFTTLDARALRRLSRPLPTDGPVVSLRTASGVDSARALVLDQVSLGDATVSGVVALHCEACAQEGAVGLLGTNFASRFEVTVDPVDQSLRLLERAGPANRVDEVRPFLDLTGTVWRLPGGGTRVEVTAANHSPRTLTHLTVLVAPKDGGDAGAFTVDLPPVAPRGAATARVDRPETVGAAFTLEPIEADW